MMSNCCQKSQGNKTKQQQQQNNKNNNKQTNKNTEFEFNVASTETVRTVRDGEPSAATSTFTQFVGRQVGSVA